MEAKIGERFLHRKFGMRNVKISAVFFGKFTKSKHVRAEINLALDLDKKITTVRFDDARFGSDLEM